MSLYYRITFKDFDLDISINLSDVNEDRNKKDLIKEELGRRIKDYHFGKIRSKYDDHDLKHIYGINEYNENNNDWDAMVDIVWKIDRPHYKALGVVKLSPCEGCRLEAPGQKDHMDEGGCLYDPDNPWY